VLVDVGVDVRPDRCDEEEGRKNWVGFYGIYGGLVDVYGVVGGRRNGRRVGGL